MSKLTQAFEGLLGTKQDVLTSFPALLGNGQGIVDVPGELNKVFVRVADQVQEVRCTRLTVRIDWLPIIVGTTAEEPNVTQVLSANLGVLNAMGYGLGTVTSHALTHQLWANGWWHGPDLFARLPDPARQAGAGSHQCQCDRLPVHSIC